MSCTALHDWVYQDTVDDQDIYACAHCGVLEDADTPEPDWDLIGKEKDFDYA